MKSKRDEINNFDYKKELKGANYACFKMSSRDSLNYLALGKRKMEVYVDLEKNKYYINVFAASYLGFISYEKASKYADYDKTLYEISLDILKKLEKVFKKDIDYKLIVPKELLINNEEFEVDTYYCNKDSNKEKKLQMNKFSNKFNDNLN